MAQLIDGTTQKLFYLIVVYCTGFPHGTPGYRRAVSVGVSVAVTGGRVLAVTSFVVATV